MLTQHEFKEAYLDRLKTLKARNIEETSNKDRFEVLVSLLRDIISEKWLNHKLKAKSEQTKQVYYFSVEFLLGRLLESNLMSLHLRDTCQEALADLGIDLHDLIQEEPDAGLGNGGLGRLAACYLDCMAGLGLIGNGCGLRYRYGFFKQEIRDGYQIEHPDDWLKNGSYAWEYRREDDAVKIKFGGNIRVIKNGVVKFIHENFEEINAVPYDVPVLGYHNDVINTLRLFSAEMNLSNEVCNSLDPNHCANALESKHINECITDCLYPDDNTTEGKILRLKQEYFLVSASLQTIIKSHFSAEESLENLSDKVAFHINDTHPTFVIPELMRILMDEHNMNWDEAFKITTKTVSYTNHTVMPEALEKWDVGLVKNLLPRIYMIIEEINARFCKELYEHHNKNVQQITDMAIISNNTIKMAHLAIVGSHKVNGVAKIHTDILKAHTMKDFYEISKQKFTNVTNGIAHRRWLLMVNPLLTDLIISLIGNGFIKRPDELSLLKNYSGDKEVLEELKRIKHINKMYAAKFFKSHYGLTVDPSSIFSAHIKRIHSYKRQSLHALYIMDLYNRLKDNPNLDITPQTFIFGGKSAFSYFKAKKTIKLINTLAEKINNDIAVRDKIKVIFLENYNVSQAELIIPASDVSIQIPTAGHEACGTGNMKFMMNGAITIGTLDGANVEIKNLVGPENIFIFGLKASQVLDYHRFGGYNSYDIYQSDPRVKRILDSLVNGFFKVHHDEFRVHYDAFLKNNDHFFVLKDFASYIDSQNALEKAYKDENKWYQMSLNNIANSGYFAGDRAFAQYATDIWDLDLTDNSLHYWQQSYLNQKKPYSNENFLLN
ncbi:glycogen/starch/alpha-glucan phosphorylase [Selenomonadales bacterium OttesenSCG-928-I06]|nr:glycogen/starch/alpha-glucan phosphorylase [Selenomonadales bacterium OttesenSCG-928-I06]